MAILADSINNNGIYAVRAEADKDGNRIDTVYAKKSEIPSKTSDLTNDSNFVTSSDMPSSDELVPSASSGDVGKVLTVDSQGNPSWVTPSGGTTYSAGDGIAIDGNNVISADVDGSTIGIDSTTKKIKLLSTIPAAQVQSDWNEADTNSKAYIQNKPTIPAAVTVDQTYSASSTNAQSGVAVAEAIASIPAPSVDEVPAVTSTDDGKVLTASYSGGTGSYSWEASSVPSSKPLVAGSNITITDGANDVTIAATIPSVDEVPAVTSSDDGKVLTASYSGGTGSYSWQTPSGGGSSPVELPALAYPPNNQNIIRFEFESSSFDPSTDSTLSTLGTWTQVTADPNRNVWDVTTANTQKLFKNKVTSSVCMCQILDSYFYVTTLTEYFSDCTGITSFKGGILTGSTSTSITVGSMFYQCNELKSVEIHQVYSSGNHFVDYYNLKFNAAKYMFYNCGKLETVSFCGVNYDGTGFAYADVVGSCKEMCRFCKNLRTFSGMIFWHVTDASWMFSGCYSLENITDTFITCSGSAVSAFESCTRLRRIDKLSAKNLGAAFKLCSALTSIGYVDASSATSMGEMCYGCSRLTDVYVINTESITSMDSVFRNCSSLRSIPDMSYNSVTAIDHAFENMSIISGGANTLYTQLSSLANITSHTDTFKNCGSSTVSGTTELAQIPSSWGGTGA